MKLPNIMNADGSGVSRLTNLGIGNVYRGQGFPRWSPDGTRIAFFSFFEGGGVYIVIVDGGSVTRLTQSGGLASWSPDGIRLIFGGDNDKPSGLYVINADGSGLIRLTTDDHANDYWPDWQP